MKHNHVGLVQSGHSMKCKLFWSWYSWTFTHLEL